MTTRDFTVRVAVVVVALLVAAAAIVTMVNYSRECPTVSNWASGGTGTFGGARQEHKIWRLGACD